MNLSEQSTAQLQKTEKVLKGASIGLGVVLLAIIILSIVMWGKKGTITMNIMPVVLLPILILNITNLKKIREELKSRGV
ncbi:hypothetical protein SAMN05444266_10833 [Chitinophaga jiangningensis]|uniref:Redox-active disulfide protein 2 n=1 Tax=Chitinophaga jiangningensis TaxID=1419482 RepID=A0A1M7INI7_9BACT|nr:hypothetical protein [Chitinophaga jiangningensis]SHM42239.1 hypothetical protein SAMN05444266_10833 [Chitinophaga jiangningensis]